MRTINDIVPPSRRREEAPTVGEGAPRQPLRLSERRPTFPYKTLIATLLVLAVSLGALFYFSTTRVEIVPNTVTAAVQNSFTATQGAGDLPYEIISAQKVASQSVAGSGTKVVNTFASGTLTIYNTQAKSQRLIANTRFMTTAGLIFRIHEAVVIPAGSTAKPGSIRVTVYADKTGSTYNIDPTSFTIPGFAGTPLATAVYAQSSGSMTGGASGTIPAIDATVEKQAQDALVAALAPELTASLETQIPAGFILLPGSATTTFEELTPTPSPTTGQVEVKEQGTITAIVFPNSALAKSIASSISGLNYQGEPLTLLPTSKLQFSTAQFPSANATSASFTLSGTASLVYSVDPTRIAAAVAGKTRSAAEVVLTNYPEVKRAIIILRPFWRHTFPQDPSGISIVVDNP